MTAAQDLHAPVAPVALPVARTVTDADSTALVVLATPVVRGAALYYHHHLASHLTMPAGLVMSVVLDSNAGADVAPSLAWMKVLPAERNLIVVLDSLVLG